MKWSALKRDLKSEGYSSYEIQRIVNGIRRNYANREKNVLKTYESICVEGSLLHIYGEDGYGFVVDNRKSERTFGEICG